MAGSFEGRVALVTGGARGFGEAIATTLADRGAAVAVLDLDGDGAREIGQRLGGVGVMADVADAEAVTAAVGEIESALGPVDVLVNNAGIASFRPLEELEREEWDRTLAVNLTSLFVCCKAVTPAMCERGSGAIVNIASLAGKRGGGILGKCAYATGKAGVLGFTKAIARELAPYGVRANAVAPAAFDTEMTKVFRTDRELLERVLTTIPLARLGQPIDVANAVAFLASDEAAYVTGETINLDGGILME